MKRACKLYAPRHVAKLMIRFGLGAINSENMLTSNTATWTKQDQMVATVWAALEGGEHCSCMEGL
jgi:hypothetical protein